MEKSAFERYFAQSGNGFVTWFRSHDRFVLIAFFLSLLPLPPACFIAVAISMINVFLLMNGMLDKSERRFVYLSVLLSITNSLVSAAAMLWVYRNIDDLPMGAASPYIPDSLERTMDLVAAYLRWFFGSTPLPGVSA